MFMSMEFSRQPVKSRIALAVSICFEMTSVFKRLFRRHFRPYCLSQDTDLFNISHVRQDMVCFGLKKNARVSTNMPKNIKVVRSEILFIFCQLFIC